MAKPRNIGEDILSLRKAGHTYSSIAKVLGCSKNTINYWCKKEGLEDIGHKNPNISDEMKQAIFEFCKQDGNTIKMAMKRFELSESTIKKYKKGGFVDQKSHE